MSTLLSALLVLFATVSLAAAEVVLPFEVDSRFGSILVTLKINSRPAVLLLDTGAASTFVSAEVMGIPARDLERSRFAGEGFEVRGVWKNAFVEAGSWRRQMEVGVVNVTPIRERYGRGIDGLLGQDVLRQFRRVTIDFQAKTLTLSR